MLLGELAPDAQPRIKPVRRTGQASPTEREFLPSLQAVRAIAALFVVLFHAAEVAQDQLHFTLFGGAFSWGSCGVDLFFVLSGFVICHVHAADVGRPERGRGYLLKRLIRVFPLYWLLLAGLVAATFAIPSLGSPADRGLGHIASSFALFPQRDLPILGVAWTLSHEVFFYALFSLLIWRGGSGTRAVLTAILAGSVLVCFLEPAVSMRPGPESTLPVAVSFCFSHFNLEFALGTGVALLFRRWKKTAVSRSAIVPLLLSAAGIALFALRASFPQTAHGALPDPLFRVLTYGVGAALLIFAGLRLDAEKRGARLFRLLAPIGDSSYALYLIHRPFLAALTLLLGHRLTGGSAQTAFYLALIFAVTAIAWVLHRAVERPMLKFLRDLLLPARRS